MGLPQGLTRGRNNAFVWSYNLPSQQLLYIMYYSSREPIVFTAQVFTFLLQFAWVDLVLVLLP